MIHFQSNLDVLVIILFLASITGCSIESENLIEDIDNQKIITIYTKCENLNTEIDNVKDHYLFKIKDKVITLTERHGDRVTNRQSTNFEIEQKLKDFVKISSNENNIVDDCMYFVKCGVQESRLYPTPEEVLYLDQVILSFVEENN